jgi:UDP-GlcNAc:undecaprenyl-phosphate GlcNAc-1-phosphate transferase
MPGNPLDWTFHYAASFLTALVATLLITRVFRDRWAGRLGLLEAPGLSDQRDWPVAKVGGIAMCVAISVVAVAATALSPLPTEYPGEARALIPVLFGALAMCGVGLWDDLHNLSPGRKLLLQVLVAAAVWYAGARFGSFRLPVLGVIELSSFASLVFTVVWFVAISNAFNLVDGADGVAGGAALTATVAMFVVALVLQQPMAAQVLIVLAAALLGFLFFNFPPATVFMGDSGSLSIGFLLAGVGLVSSSKATTVAAVAIPVVSLGLPILDTGLAIVRRLLRGEGVHKRDLGHIHHRLQKLGHSPRQVALILYAASAVLALASLILLSPDMAAVGLVFLVVGTAAFIGMQRLKIPELLELRRLITRGLRQPAVIARSVALREAVTGVSGALDLDAMLVEVGRAFEQTDFLEAEIRFVRAPGVRERDEVVWRWERPGDGVRGDPAGEGIEQEESVEVTRLRLSGARRWTRASGAESWEARVPFVGPDANALAGWITVRRPLDEHTPAELEVLTRTLLPAVSRRVLAVREGGEQLELGAEGPGRRRTDEEVA